MKYMCEPCGYIYDPAVSLPAPRLRISPTIGAALFAEQQRTILFPAKTDKTE